VTKRLACVIVDDEQGAIEVLSAFANKVSWLELSATFTDPMEALNYLSIESVDLVFMDINMPDLDGIQLARLIQNTGANIIFCTAYPEHAVESYEVQALDYLLKPVPFDRFLAAANRAQGKRNPTGVGERHTGEQLLTIDFKNNVMTVFLDITDSLGINLMNLCTTFDEYLRMTRSRCFILLTHPGRISFALSSVCSSKKTIKRNRF